VSPWKHREKTCGGGTGQRERSAIKVQRRPHGRKCVPGVTAGGKRRTRGVRTGLFVARAKGKADQETNRRIYGTDTGGSKR